MGFVVGYYSIDVFGEAAASPGGTVEINFLQGRVVRGRPSEQLERAAVVFAQFFPDFCKKNGAEVADFKSFLAAFDARGGKRRSVLTVVDRDGNRSRTEYDGVPLKRIKVLDGLGRIRRQARVVEKPSP